jgi:hypothetical protein
MEIKQVLLKNVPPGLWPKFKACAALKQEPINTVIVRLVAAYVQESTPPSDHAQG